MLSIPQSLDAPVEEGDRELLPLDRCQASSLDCKPDQKDEGAKESTPRPMPFDRGYERDYGQSQRYQEERASLVLQP